MEFEMICERGRLIICSGLVKEKEWSIVHQFQFLLEKNKWTNEIKTFSRTDNKNKNFGMVDSISRGVS